jgi:hypothetical protein
VLRYQNMYCGIKKSDNAMTVLYVFVHTFLFPLKGGYTVACTDKKRSYIIIHLTSGLVCENLRIRHS